jgi:hypothetical protein
MATREGRVGQQIWSLSRPATRASPLPATREDRERVETTGPVPPLPVGELCSAQRILAAEGERGRAGGSSSAAWRGM